MRRPVQHTLLMLATLVPAACKTVVPPPPEELDLWDDAAAGVSDERLADLAADFWEAELAAHPIRATYLGDPRYNGEVPRTDERWKSARREELEGLRRRHVAIDPDDLGPEDRITWRLLGEEIRDETEALGLELETFTVDPLDGPQVSLISLSEVQPTRTARERAQLVERWRGFASVLHEQVRDLTRGRKAGRTPSTTAVVKVIDQIEEILDTPVMDSPLIECVTGGGHWVDLPPGASVAEVAHEELGDARHQRELRQVNLHLQDGERLVIGTRVLVPAPDDPLTPAQRGELLHGALVAVEEGFYPALASYRDFLRDQMLLVSRDDDEVGLCKVPGGERIYRELIHQNTSLPLDECDPQAIHRFGLDEVARIRAEIATLGERVLGTSDVAEIQRRMRHDDELHFRTRAEVEAKAKEALSRARRALGPYFGILPHAPCVVVRVPAHEERDTTIAYYREPSADGTLPGRYFINTFAPETRPRYEAEVLAYHESIPGHHLQIAIAQERPDLPRFRRHLGCTAFVEGWALYGERLSDQMGLYSSDLDRLGMLSFDAWRACRLVVDTGIHAFGWSRDQAIDYMLENTLLARNNIENEVDRYIAWPGQALAYKIGQREILELREQARDALGPAFSYADFHDRVLENGAVTLSVLRAVVRDWLGLSGRPGVS